MKSQSKHPKRHPSIPLPVVDRALLELGKQRKSLADYKRAIRDMEIRLYRLSGYHRTTQKKAA